MRPAGRTVVGTASYADHVKAAKQIGLKILGWVLLVVGIAAIPLPGPGAMIILASMFVLATQYEWADRRLERVKLWALEGAADSVKTWPRIVVSLLGVVWLVGFGLYWGSQPPAPGWWPLPQSLWLPGGWWTAGTLIASGFIALGLIVYSFVKLRGKDFSQHKRRLKQQEQQVAQESERAEP